MSCKVLKMLEPLFLHQTLPFQIYTPFLAKNLIPPKVTQFLEGPTPFNKGGGPIQLCWLYFYALIIGFSLLPSLYS